MKSVQTPTLPIPGQLCLPPPVHDIKNTSYWKMTGIGCQQNIFRFEEAIRAIDRAIEYLTTCKLAYRKDTHVYCAFLDDIESIREKKAFVLQEYWEFEQTRRQARNFGAKLRRKYERSVA